MRVRHDHLLEQAHERFDVQDYHGAIHLLDELIASGRSFADAHHLMGLCWSLLGQSGRALESFDRALELNSRYIEAHIHRGLVLNELGRVVEADAAFARAAAGGRRGAAGLPAAVAAQLANRHAELAEAYAEAGQSDEAVRQLQRAVELGPGFHDLRHRLARRLLEAGRALEAREELETILAAVPDQHDVTVSLGLAHYLAGDHATAGQIWLRARERRPEDARIAAYLAMIDRAGS